MELRRQGAGRRCGEWGWRPALSSRRVLSSRCVWSGPYFCLMLVASATTFAVTHTSEWAGQPHMVKN
jgi:hypothetical protein